MTDSDREWTCFYEQQLLGALLLSLDAEQTFDDIVAGGMVTPEDFWDDRVSAAFKVVFHLVKSGEAITALAVLEGLRAESIFSEESGSQWLISVMDNSLKTSVALARQNSNLASRFSASRKIVQIGEDIVRRKDDFSRPDDFLEMAKSALSSVNLDGREQEKTSLLDLLTEQWPGIEDRLNNGSPAGIATGLEALDEQLIGLIDTELYVVGGRPGQGKTQLGLNLAHRIASRGSHVFFASLEMPRREILERLLCIDGKVDQQAMKRGRDGRDEMTHERLLDDLNQSASRLSNLPLFISDISGQSVSQIAARCRRVIRERGHIDVVIVDYLQIVKPEDDQASREQQVSMVSRRLKDMAKELGVAVVALAQLNRAVESRADKRPYLSDLRESGGIEMDADIVMFLHRPSYYVPTDRPGEADVIIAKNRRGPLATVALAWQATIGRFENLADQQFDAASNAFGNRDR